MRALRSAPDGAHALDRYTEAARLLTGDPSATVEDGLAWIRDTLRLLAVPGLASFGIEPSQADDIAAAAARSSSMQGNPVPLPDTTLRDIILQSL